MSFDAPVIAVVAAIIFDDARRLLLVRKQGAARFMLPGGKPEPGESSLVALARELGEEPGCAMGELVVSLATSTPWRQTSRAVGSPRSLRSRSSAIRSRRRKSRRSAGSTRSTTPTTSRRGCVRSSCLVYDAR